MGWVYLIVAVIVIVLVVQYWYITLAIVAIGLVTYLILKTRNEAKERQTAAELTRCTECNGMVSSNARQCPHCGRYPRFTSCPICGRRNLKLSEAIIVRHEFSSSDSTALHQDCFESMVSQKVKCPICYKEATCRELVFDQLVYNGHSLKQGNELISLYSTSTAYHLKYDMLCSQCGHQIVTRSCRACRLPIPQNENVEIVISFRDDYSRGYAHTLCLPYLKQNFLGVHVASESKCLIATAIYGTHSLEVLTLRIFRDEYLSLILVGRAFIVIYEYLSPCLAEIIEKRPLVRALTRWLIINPVYHVVKLYVKIW